ncbi:MAG: toxin-antitoxin system YwqK family antitoxin [Parachlamydiaceae bacterium]
MRYLILMGAVFGLAGCQSTVPYSEDPVEVVDECYMHKYGVEVPPKDWDERGQEGQVVTTLKNGIVVTKNYVAGVLDGETTYTFPHSSTIEKIEIYSRDDLVAESLFYRSGTPKQKITYEGSPNRRLVSTWYSNGSLYATEKYDRQYLVNGEYFTIAGQSEAKIVDGHGLKARRDQYGELLSMDNYQHGNLTLSTSYYPNGTPKEMTPYHRNVIDGQVKKFLPSGEPLAIEEWAQGQQSGLTILFENGEKIAELNYKNGLKHGLEKRFNEHMMVVEETTWINDVKHGPATTYINDHVKTDWFFKGKPVTQLAFERMTSARSF